MKKIFCVKLLLISMLAGVNAQAPAANFRTGNPDFDSEIARLLDFSVPFISADELRQHKEKYLIFDTREPAEYAVSHIPGAKYLGFDKFDASQLSNIPQNTPIVLYCSIGYRSEKTGNKLQKMGFTQVYNLYGSIFEWANKGFPLENQAGKPAKILHTYDEKWSHWVKNQQIKKTW
jgi:rhodanese-related sulfurtransferase